MGNLGPRIQTQVQAHHYIIDMYMDYLALDYIHISIYY